MRSNKVICLNDRDPDIYFETTRNKLVAAFKELIKTLPAIQLNLTQTFYTAKGL